MQSPQAKAQRAYEQRTNNAAKQKYNRDKTRSINLRLVKSTDADIISKLDSIPNKSGYIKSLIRADLTKGDRNEN